MTLECVVNLSEGRDRRFLEDCALACGDQLLDRHNDPDYHRSVFTLAGKDDLVLASVQSLARLAITRLDISTHDGVHPRFGVVDVVPFVPLIRSPSNFLVDPPLDTACAARDAFASWMADELGVPTFLYGPPSEGCSRAGPPRTLPDIRRGAFLEFPPEFGPGRPHPTAGSCAVGARTFLIAYNIALAGGTPDLAKHLAASVREPGLRALGFSGSTGWHHVSCNLVRPDVIGPAEVYDRVSARLREGGVGARIHHAELVGLIPNDVLDRIDVDRWDELGLGRDSTLEARLATSAG